MSNLIRIGSYEVHQDLVKHMARDVEQMLAVMVLPAEERDAIPADSKCGADCVLVFEAYAILATDSSDQVSRVRALKVLDERLGYERLVLASSRVTARQMGALARDVVQLAAIYMFG